MSLWRKWLLYRRLQRYIFLLAQITIISIIIIIIIVCVSTKLKGKLQVVLLAHVEHVASVVYKIMACRGV
jgi:hypothetical protein